MSRLRRSAHVDEFVTAEDAILVRVETFEAFGGFSRVGLVGEEFFAGQLVIAALVLPLEERGPVLDLFRGERSAASDLRFGFWQSGQDGAESGDDFWLLG